MLWSVPWLTSGWYAVYAGTQEADLRHPIAAGQPRQFSADLLLGQRRREVPIGGANGGRDIGEEVIDRGRPDRLEHALAVGIGVRRVGHGRDRSAGLGGIRIGVEQRLELAATGELDPGDPALTERIGVQELGRLPEGVVDLDDLARDRRVEV